MTLIAYVFWNLQTVENVVKQMSKKSSFTRLSDKQYAKQAQTLLKSATFLTNVKAIELEKVSLSDM